MSELHRDELEAFAAVARERHFGRGAERLGALQPVISRRISRLEERLGVALLDRSTRAVRVTPAGQVLLDKLPSVLNMLDRTVDEVRLAGTGVRRRFDVGFVGSAAIEALPALAHEVRRRLPESRLLVTEMTDEDVVGHVAGGLLDIGLVRIAPRGAGVVVEDLYSEPLAAVVARGHGIAARTSVPLGALADEDWVFWPERVGPLQHRALWRLCREAGFSPRVVQEASSVAAMLALVAGGFGVGVAAGCYAKQTPSEVALVPLRGVSTSMALVYRRDRAAELDAIRTCARVLRR